MKKFAELIIKYRLVFLIIISIATILWATQIPKVKIATSFGDLLPQTHPYIKVHNQLRETFGGANSLLMLLEVKDGDIFNKDTLGKIKNITEQLYLVPGIDRYKILSLAQEKLKVMKFTSWGLESKPLMFPNIPQNNKEMRSGKQLPSKAIVKSPI